MSVFFLKHSAQTCYRLSAQRLQPFSVSAYNFAAANDNPRDGGRRVGGSAAAQRQQLPEQQQQQMRQQMQHLQQEVQKARPSSNPAQQSDQRQTDPSMGIRQAAGQVEHQRQQQLQQNQQQQQNRSGGQSTASQQQQPQQNQQRNNTQPQGQQPSQQQQQERHQAQNAREPSQRGSDQNEAGSSKNEQRQTRDGDRRGQQSGDSSGQSMMQMSGGRGDNTDGGEISARDHQPSTIKPNRYLAKTPTGLIEPFKWNYADRDVENFPRLMPQRYPLETRHFFLPRSYFDFFYSKTGATGGYTFGLTLIAYLLSKEWFVLEHEANMFIPLAVVTFMGIKYGMPKFNEWYEKGAVDIEQNLIEFQEQAMDYLQEELDLQDNRVYSAEAGISLAQAKRENVALQQEVVYRQRLKEAYDEIKKRLDYLVAVQTAQRRAEKKHMMQWIIQNVRESLSQQPEKETLRACVDALKQMKPTLATH